MAISPDSLKNVRQRRYLARDFDSLRSVILEYARQYYPDRIQDFSESSVGGMFLDMAAYVGDNLSFYLDHQYSELNYETVVETANVQRILRTAGVPITGASPAVVPCTVYVEVPAATSANTVAPDSTALPIVKMNSVFTSDSGIDFILLEDIDFSSRRSDGTYYADIKVGQKSTSGVVQTFIMALSGICVSGRETTETVTIGSQFVPFRKITLTNANVTDVISVTDGYGNVYYQVADLSNDVVYKNVLNTARDNDLVKDAIKIIPAPYRYVMQGELASRKTVLTFGGGSADTLEDDVIPDPSDFAISFPYARTFSRISLDPERLLTTKTLGVAAVDTTLTLTYRYGGGLNHNVPADNVRTVKSLLMEFPSNPSSPVASRVRGSTEVTNKVRASGGEDAPASEDLISLVPSIKNSQERIVTRPDLLARVYTIPSNFGRVFRAAIRSNPNNPLATQLYVVSRTPEGQLITSPDTLKTNIVKYLNPYRMISDAIDILDARIINMTLSFEVVIDPALNRSIVLQNILTKLQNTFNIKNYHIDQPIIVSDVTNTIFTVQGIVSVDRVQFSNITGVVNNNTYSDQSFDVSSNTKNNIIIPPPGGIFEVRFPEYDIVGRAI